MSDPLCLMVVSKVRPDPYPSHVRAPRHTCAGQQHARAGIDRACAVPEAAARRWAWHATPAVACKPHSDIFRNLETPTGQEPAGAGRLPAQANAGGHRGAHRGVRQGRRHGECPRARVQLELHLGSNHRGIAVQGCPQVPDDRVRCLLERVLRCRCCVCCGGVCRCATTASCWRC